MRLACQPYLLIRLLTFLQHRYLQQQIFLIVFSFFQMVSKRATPYFLPIQHSWSHSGLGSHIHQRQSHKSHRRKLKATPPSRGGSETQVTSPPSILKKLGILNKAALALPGKSHTKQIFTQSHSTSSSSSKPHQK